MKKRQLIVGISLLSAFSLLSVQAEAISLSFEPTTTSVNVSEVFEVDIVLFEMTDLDTISTFDLDIDFDSAILSFDSYALGDGLGDISIGDAMDWSWGDLGGGTVNVSELSSIMPDAMTGDSFFADQFTPTSDSLVLATLSFTAIAPGSSDLSFFRVVLGDEWGMGSMPTLTTATVTSTAPVPEPATLLLFGTGIVGLVGSRRRRKK